MRAGDRVIGVWVIVEGDTHVGIYEIGDVGWGVIGNNREWMSTYRR